MIHSDPNKYDGTTWEIHLPDSNKITVSCFFPDPIPAGTWIMSRSTGERFLREDGKWRAMPNWRL